LQPSVYVIIPAFNEEKSIAKVIAEIPVEIITEIVVVDNASTDATAAAARSANATVLHESIPGYGRACLQGINYCRSKNPPPEIIVFLDGDYSDYPEEIPLLIRPIIENNADLVIGSRALGKKEKGSMTPQQVFGNWLATALLKLFYNVKFTDLGPFRAIRFSSLIALNMQDKTFGWTVEMQLKGAKHGLQCVEVPVRYRKRIGISKISGTLKGTVMAGYKILLTIFRYL
jgi:glycosyltransferase involved in cell wall biosynthesis